MLCGNLHNPFKNRGEYSFKIHDITAMCTKKSVN